MDHIKEAQKNLGISFECGDPQESIQYALYAITQVLVALVKQVERLNDRAGGPGQLIIGRILEE